MSFVTSNGPNYEKAYFVPPAMMSFFYFCTITDILQHSNHRSLVDTPGSRNALLNHLQNGKLGTVINSSFFTMIC